MKRRSRKTSVAVGAALAVAALLAGSTLVDMVFGAEAKDNQAALKWAEKVAADVTDVASMNNKTPATLSQDELATIKTLLEENSDLQLTILAGQIEVSAEEGAACVTLAGGLYTKSKIAEGACSTETPTEAPFIQETEDQGKAIVALQKWSSKTLKDPAWAKLETAEQAALYVSKHLVTQERGVKLDQPFFTRLRATYGSGEWCATFVRFSNGMGIKLESCSSPMPFEEAATNQ